MYLSCVQFHHQVKTSGGLAALACYTVDSDSDTEEEDEEKKVDFGDLYIKEEPVWSLDTVVQLHISLTWQLLISTAKRCSSSQSVPGSSPVQSSPVPTYRIGCCNLL